MTSKGFASSYRIVLLSAGLFVCFAGVGVRLVWLHVVDRDSLLKTIKQVRHQLITETARRGDILDANGAWLATSTSRIVLGVDPSVLKPEQQKKWPELAALIGLPEAELRAICLTKYRQPAKQPASAPGVLNLGPLLAGGERRAAGADAPAAARTAAAADESAEEDESDEPQPIQWAVLRDEISEELYAQVLKLGIAGVYGQRGYRRVYPSNSLASHVVGYVNRQEEPVTGMELYADFFLRAQAGWRVGEKDGRGRELAQYLSREVPRADGFSVMLSINLTVQDIIEQELAYIAAKFAPLKATIIVSDPRTGFILGMANYPTFNPNEYNKVPKEEYARLKNVAVTDIYEPGSVFKIIPVAAALEERLAYPQSAFDCSLEKILHRGRMVDLPAEDHRMGELSVAEIISHSSNKGAAQLGVLLGEERLHRYARAFGFGAKLGFPIGPEVGGMLHPYKRWNPIDITRIPMGHSVSATVLQMHQAMCVIAADGVFVRPQIIREIRDASGELVERFDRDELHRVVSVDTARKVAAMLIGVTTKGGTAVEAAIDGFEVAGKTGTTQKLVPQTRADGSTTWVYSNQHHIASFVGFFPARPPSGGEQVAISVIVDEARQVPTPSGVAYGRVVAAPSFKRIGERLIPILPNIKSNSQPGRSAGLIAMHQGGNR